MPSDNAVENGLAILALADLQIGCFRGGGDAVAFRVNQIQRRFFAANLAAQNQGGTEIYRVLSGLLRIFLLRAYGQGTDVFRRIVHMRET